MYKFNVAAAAMAIIADVFCLHILLAYPDSRNGLIVGIFVLELICTFVFLFFLPNSIKMIKQKKVKQKAEEESRSKAKAYAETKKLIERHQFALQLVERCEKENIKPLETEEDKSNLWLIAGSMGVKTKEESLALYKEGISPSKEILELIEKDKSETYTKEREDECRKIRLYQDYQEKHSDLIGRDKYTTWALELKSTLLREADELTKLSAYAYTHKPMTSSTVKNPALESIKGELVGGIGLGTAKAIEALNANAENAARQARFAEKRRKSAKDFESWASKYRRQAKRLNWYIDSVNSKLIDIEHSEKYASLIKGQVTKAEATEGGNLRLQLQFTVESKSEVLGREAFLDGIVEITAKLGDEIVGTTVYYPHIFTIAYDEIFSKEKPREMQTYSIHDIEDLKGEILTGFIPEKKIDYVYILTTTEVSDENLQSIRFEITPRQAWAVEGKRNQLYTF